jgi:GNAT superfamily N-acetyltransferase
MEAVMELPISPQSYRPDSATLVRAIHHSALVLAQSAADVVEVDGAALICRPDRPGVRAVNFATAVAPVSGQSAQEQVTQLLEHFTRQQCQCEVVYPALDRLSPDLENALAGRGYHAAVRQVFLMQNYARPARINANLQIVPARAIYGQLHDFYRHMASVEYHASPELADHIAQTRVDFLDDTRLEVLIARLDGRNVACAGVMSQGQIGVIVPAWSDPSLRGQGLAGTLMSHVMDLCARALYQQVILDRAEHCPAIGFYQSLGFAPVTAFTKYRRSEEGDEHHG